MPKEVPNVTDAELRNLLVAVRNSQQNPSIWTVAVRSRVKEMLIPSRFVKVVRKGSSKRLTQYMLTARGLLALKELGPESIL